MPDPTPKADVETAAAVLWNAQADEFNQWPSLGADEQREWIGRMLEAARRRGPLPRNNTRPDQTDGVEAWDGSRHYEDEPDA